MTELLRILHLEDSQADAELVEHILRKNGLDFTLLRVETGTEFVDELNKFQPDIILADYSLPTFDGMKALQIALEKVPLTPFIFVTGTLGEDIAVETLKNGASDYILKDRLTRLPSALQQALEKKDACAIQMQAEQALLASEKKFRTIFDSSADAILILDEHGFIDCNPAALKMYGCATQDDLIGQYPARISARTQAGGEDSLSLVDQYIAKAFNKSILHFEWASCRLDGGEFFSDVLLIPIEIDSRKLLQMAVRDISERKKSEDMIWQQANFDALTGLPNRRMVYDRLELEIKKVQRDGKTVALMFIDLDHFKEVNDTLGHAEGDALLKEAAQRIVGCVRETDTVGRPGGDEFTIVMSELDNALILLC